MIETAKLIITIKSNKKTKEIRTESVFDNRIRDYWTEEQIQERGRDFKLEFRRIAKRNVQKC